MGSARIKPSLNSYERPPDWTNGEQEPQQSLARIRAQSGDSLLSAFHERIEGGEIVKLNKGIPVYDHYRLKVPYKTKKLILDALSLFDFTRESPFPGLDEAAKAVIEKFSAAKSTVQLPDPPEREPEDMTSFDHLTLSGSVHHLVQYLGNPETTIVARERYVTPNPPMDGARTAEGG